MLPATPICCFLLPDGLQENHPKCVPGTGRLGPGIRVFTWGPATKFWEGWMMVRSSDAKIAFYYFHKELKIYEFI